LSLQIKAIGLLLINRNIAAMGECQREFADSMRFDLIVTNGIIVSTGHFHAAMMFARKSYCLKKEIFCECTVPIKKKDGHSKKVLS